MIKSAATSVEEKKKQLKAAAAEVEKTKKQMEAAAARVEEEKKKVEAAKAAVAKNKIDVAAADAAVTESAKELSEEKKRCRIQIEETDESSSEDEKDTKPAPSKSNTQKSKIRYEKEVLFRNEYHSLLLNSGITLLHKVFIANLYFHLLSIFRVDMGKSTPSTTENTDVKQEKSSIQVGYSKCTF